MAPMLSQPQCVHSHFTLKTEKVAIPQNYLVWLEWCFANRAYFSSSLEASRIWHIEAEAKWTTFLKLFSWTNIVVFWFKFHWNLFPNGPINDELWLVQMMAWRRTGDKPSTEPMMAYFTDAYIGHSATRRGFHRII